MSTEASNQAFRHCSAKDVGLPPPRPTHRKNPGHSAAASRAEASADERKTL